MGTLLNPWQSLADSLDHNVITALVSTCMTLPAFKALYKSELISMNVNMPAFCGLILRLNFAISIKIQSSFSQELGKNKKWIRCLSNEFKHNVVERDVVLTQ